MRGLKALGVSDFVLCPGSRSAPLAIAAGGLSKSSEINLFTAIDERSAGFLAVGLAAARGRASLVITTSGTAVGNLLPAAIEADRSCIPIIFITADRPSRLKNCGSNQTVNQEDFLKAVSRSVLSGPAEGVHKLDSDSLRELLLKTCNSPGLPPGPIHFNLPIEEPLYPSLVHQKEVWEGWKPSSFYLNNYCPEIPDHIDEQEPSVFTELDASHPGIVIAGPWRGSPRKLKNYQKCLERWHEISGWPIFADPLSGISFTQKGLIKYWELILSCEVDFSIQGLQILRLGPLPASKILEHWLSNVTAKQILITEDDDRPLDPLKLASQYSKGFANWFDFFLNNPLKNDKSNINKSSKELTTKILSFDKEVDLLLSNIFTLENNISEPLLAYSIPKIAPIDISIMLSASSPVRDWITFSGSDIKSRRCFSFRGASGIDGTLSLAEGLASSLGPTLLITGDLALLHDTNAWLFAQSNRIPLIVLLIDNEGGGIFTKLNSEPLYKGDFDELFIMHQSVDLIELASAYKIPTREITCFNDLKPSLDWGFAQKRTVLLRVSTNSSKDNSLRNNILDNVYTQIRSSITKTTNHS
ncbi:MULTISPECIES: 2-succinyl-5-enolpyruvyl-6-hydroxy-3-cyclohexene-1-carboxylic-acid synthase [Prochlorococcus]|uniref:2-succinyl-5-enolpyruvyl-6-hydroxy-3- cyclohexene-1-carboxylic-acid synthase n=1 Tax=Prochlorococcus TaxID=1218 RepID=UPI0005337E98|nr:MULTISPECIES: 2-succinyl-5-enolpyruvyl-6-hydroxy-3-cyclohexene-1-carboxylic-acid synthase [Prochlorococcus]KGG12303.1 2-succinyl-5-enolpyruvyl-6-hydroxy-3- cyclohexene-1-carboxylic-acid synthase [Prochlorococcus sp. MIT 0601]